jgi:pyruvate formate lyase activating enzyme
METGIIFDIKRYAIHDGPGIRTTVFFKGCPLSCQWCHNPEGISSFFELMFRNNRCVGCEECLKTCKKGAISFVNSTPKIDRTKCDLCGECADACPSGALELAGKSYTVEQLLAEIEKDRVFFEESGGGVTFSGGEPLLQADFLKAVLERCKKQGIHTALDTSGFAPYEVINTLKANVDLFLYDLKMIDEKRHIRYTGVSNKIILENLKKLSRNGSRILVRIPLIPQVNDTKDCIQRIAAFIAGILSLKHVSLLPYHDIAAQKYERLNRPSEMPNSSRLPEEKIDFIKHIFEDTGLHVTIGN